MYLYVFLPRRPGSLPLQPSASSSFPRAAKSPTFLRNATASAPPASVNRGWPAGTRSFLRRLPPGNNLHNRLPNRIRSLKSVAAIVSISFPSAQHEHYTRIKKSCQVFLLDSLKYYGLLYVVFNTKTTTCSFRPNHRFSSEFNIIWMKAQDVGRKILLKTPVPASASAPMEPPAGLAGNLTLSIWLYPAC